MRMRRWLCLLSFLLLVLSAPSAAQVNDTPRPAPATPVAAILGAMTVEVEALGQELKYNRQERQRWRE